MSESTSVKRGVSLSAKTNGDLVELCDALGISPHSYMVNEIAKAVQRDSIALRVNSSQRDALDAILELMKSGN